MFSKIFVLFLCSFYLSLSCKSGEIAVDGIDGAPIIRSRVKRGVVVMPPVTPATPPQKKRTREHLSPDENLSGEVGPFEAVPTPPQKKSRALSSPTVVDSEPPRRVDPLDAITAAPKTPSPKPKKSTNGKASPRSSRGTPSTKGARANASPSPKACPSPFCRSGTGGCVDPRVVRASANYAFGGGVGTKLCDPWLDRNLASLRGICRRNNPFFLKKNCAKAGLQLVYKYRGQLKYSKIYGLKTLFVSGGKPVFEKLHLKNSLRVKTVFDCFPRGGGPLVAQMRTTMKSLFSAADKTKLSGSTFAARRGEICSPKPVKKSKGKVSLPNSAFGRAYLHSEQGILLTLAYRPRVLAPLLSQLRAGSTIHQLTVLIASKNEMCRQCASAFFRASEGAGHIKTNLVCYMRNFPKKGFKIAKKGLHLFAAAAGLKPFDRVRRGHREEQLVYAEAPITDSRKFAPHVLDRLYGKRKQRPSSVPPLHLDGDDVNPV